MNSGVPSNNLIFIQIKRSNVKKGAFNSLNFLSWQNFLSSSKVYDLDAVVDNLFSFFQRTFKDDIFWLKMYFVLTSIN